MIAQATFLAVLVLSLAGCPIPDPPPVKEPRELVPPVAGGPVDEECDIDSDLGPSDHWIEAYGLYFTTEQRRAYLATPPEARFDRWGLFLLDLRLREDLLASSQDVLSRDDVERFRRLPGLAEARAFVEERRRLAAARAPKDEQGTDATGGDLSGPPARSSPANPKERR